MSLQDEIKQSSFRSEHHKGLVNLIYTYNWVKDQLKIILKPFGITMQQFNVLRILNGQSTPISTYEIRERMLDKMSDASRIVDRLYKKGWVKRTQCKQDRRLVDVQISEKGRELIFRIDEEKEAFDEILGNLEENDLVVLNELLDKLRFS